MADMPKILPDFWFVGREDQQEEQLCDWCQKDILKDDHWIDKVSIEFVDEEIILCYSCGEELHIILKKLIEDNGTTERREDQTR